MRQKIATFAPSLPLQKWVSHYWLSRDNLDSTYVALPDGAVDLVIMISDSSTFSWVYGTTTSRTDIVLKEHAHYLGIRFRPGQSRHFIKAAAAELTDNCELTQGLLCFTLDELPEILSGNKVIMYLNRLLERYIVKLQPASEKIDDAIGLIEAARGNVRVALVAESFGRSHRQFERVFQNTVGVTAKYFTSITRFHHAAEFVANGMPLAEVALEAGYADQSHLSHEFKKLVGISPGKFALQDVVFLQDHPKSISDH